MRVCDVKTRFLQRYGLGEREPPGRVNEDCGPRDVGTTVRPSQFQYADPLPRPERIAGSDNWGRTVES
jgi:hypothetical protein